MGHIVYLFISECSTLCMGRCVGLGVGVGVCVRCPENHRLFKISYTLTYVGQILSLGDRCICDFTVLARFYKFSK